MGMKRSFIYHHKACDSGLGSRLRPSACLQIPVPSARRGADTHTPPSPPPPWLASLVNQTRQTRQTCFTSQLGRIRRIQRIYQRFLHCRVRMSTLAAPIKQNNRCRRARPSPQLAFWVHVPGHWRGPGAGLARAMPSGQCFRPVRSGFSFLHGFMHTSHATC